MAYSGGAAAGAAAAAAAAAKRMREEEEDMTRYTSDELAEEWEFKIIRSVGSPFRNPMKLRRLMEEESQAGWVFIEKFDDSRVRFKRPSSARERDHLLPPGIDPYRTQYGVSEGVLGLSIAGVIVLTIGVVLLIVFLLEH